MPSFVLLLIAIGLTFVGELLLKHGMNALQASGALDRFSLSFGPLVQTGWTVFSNPSVFFGFVFIFGGSLFWLAVISKLQLSYAYPLLSMNYILVVAASYFLFHEQVSWLKVAGVLVIVAGVVLVTLGEGNVSSNP